MEWNFDFVEFNWSENNKNSIWCEFVSKLCALCVAALTQTEQSISELNRKVSLTSQTTHSDVNNSKLGFNQWHRDMMTMIMQLSYHIGTCNNNFVLRRFRSWCIGHLFDTTSMWLHEERIEEDVETQIQYIENTGRMQLRFSCHNWYIYCCLSSYGSERNFIVLIWYCFCPTVAFNASRWATVKFDRCRVCETRICYSVKSLLFNAINQFN